MFREVSNRLVNLVRRLRGDDQEMESSDNPAQIQCDQTSILVQKDNPVSKNSRRTNQVINEKTMQGNDRKNDTNDSKTGGVKGAQNREMTSETTLESRDTNHNGGLDGVPGGPLDGIFSARTSVASSYRSQGTGSSELRVFDWFNL